MMIKEDNLLNPEKRNVGIDFLRGLAILSVILLHINIRIPFDKSSIGQLFPQSVINIFFKSGYYGVIVFFVISGFIITSSSIKRWGSLKNIQAGSFYLTRFSRIAPCLFALLIILSILNFLAIPDFTIETTSLGNALFAAFTFQINLLEAKTGYLPGPWDILWSLSVEEIFYLFFPLLCISVRNKFIFLSILITFIILGPFARTVFTNNEIWSDHSYLSCMDGIAIGCLAAIFSNKLILSRTQTKLFLFIGVLLFLLVFVFRKQVYQLGLTEIGLNVTLLEVGTAFILLAFQKLSSKNVRYRFISTKPIAWLGKYSYEIYLTHMFIVLPASKMFYYWHHSAFTIEIYYIAIILTSVLTGYLIAKYYSEPLNKNMRSLSCKKNSTATQLKILDS